VFLNLTFANQAGAPSFRVLCGKWEDENLDQRTPSSPEAQGWGTLTVSRLTFPIGALDQLTVEKGTTSVVPQIGKSRAASSR
jgi:hypothetical protein